MYDLVEAYVEFLLGMKEFEKPEMPKFDVSAYTESEYLSVMEFIENDYKYLDDLRLTESFLKGD